MSERYTALDKGALAEALRSGEPLQCPVCGGVVLASPIPPRADVPYVRDRVWLRCDGCSRSIVLDRTRME